MLPSHTITSPSLSTDHQNKSHLRRFNHQSTTALIANSCVQPSTFRRMHFSHLKSPQVSHQVETRELSTILVATIEEAKDRITQIEYIFCSQLYPNFQKHSKSLEKLYLETRSAVENEWKERQSEFELQINQLCLEKERALEECKAFKAEKLTLLTRIVELENNITSKEKEVEQQMETHANLLEIIRVKTSSLTEKEQLLKEHEDRMKLLVAKTGELERNIDALNNELQVKNEEETKGKELMMEFQKRIEAQELKINHTELMLSNSEEEKKQLAIKLENLEASFKNELREKVDGGSKLHEKLVQQVNLYSTELTKKDQLLSAHEREKQMLLTRINHLESKNNGLQESLRNRNSEVTNTGESHNALAKQIEQKNAELAAERKKKRDLSASFKKLKSQYSYLLKKVGLTEDQINTEEESDLLKHDEKNITLSEIKKRSPTSTGVAYETNKKKQEMDNSKESFEDEKIGRLNQRLSSKSPSGSDSPTTANWTSSRKQGQLAGAKRPGSGWRETRSHQSPRGLDLHDDFLDTPYENIKGNLNKTTKDTHATHDVPAENSKDVDSDDETQDMRAEIGHKRQQLQAPKSGSKGFKYVEPVRKKAERENLNGIECKQCKKFYDAVLSDGGPKNGEVDKQNFRCEHHEGVSRHRYRYAPPLTPEGFWNIGFDSEI